MNMKRNPVSKVGDVSTIDLQTEESSNQVAMTPDQREIRALIKRRHPQYESHYKHWCFLEQTYDGGRDWFKDNIFRYMKEGDKEYQDRIERAYRFNHTREIVDLTNKYLFKQNITRNEVDAPQSVKDFWKSCTRNGITIKEFSRQIGKQTSIYGRVAIVIDRTNPKGQIISKADEKKAGIQTYAYIVPPEQILDYSYDEQGHLNWILLLEQHRDDDDPFKSTGKVSLRYRLWTKEQWVLIEEDKSKNKAKNYKLSAGDHRLGVVPVILADHIISDDLYVSPAMIDDIAYLDRAVANYLSNLDAVIQDQTFSQLAMPAQGISAGDDNNAKMIEIGTKRIFTYDGGESNNKPFFLSPDVKQSGLLLEVINKIINEIYHTVGLAGERTKQDNAVGIDNSSGVAKAYDFERVNALLAAKADSLEFIENRIVEMVVLWNGGSVEKELAEPLVTYPDNFDTRGLYDEFDIATRLMLVDAPESVRREQMKSILEKLFPQLSQENRDKLEKELAAWPVAVTAPQQTQTGTTNAANTVVLGSTTLKKGKGKTDNSASDSGKPQSQANG